MVFGVLGAGVERVFLKLFQFGVPDLKNRLAMNKVPVAI